MKKLFVIFMSMALCACARSHPAPAPEPGAAMQAWEYMQKISAQRAKPYRMQLSMRFGEEGNTRRVTGLLWGNGDTDSFRLDIMAGVGAAVAMIEENGEEFKLYAPRENKAYLQAGDARPLLKIGVPVPFNLAQLADLLNGNFAKVFSSQPEKAALGKNGEVYSLGGAMAGDIEVNAAGAPLNWTQRGGGWTLAFTYAEDEPLLPKSLKLRNANGKLAVILVKERDANVEQFTQQQMRLKLPAGVPVLPLSQFRAS